MITPNRIFIILILSVLISCSHKQGQGLDAGTVIKEVQQETTARTRPHVLNYAHSFEVDNTVLPRFAAAGIVTDVNDLEEQQILQGPLLANFQTQDYATALQEALKDEGFIASADIDEGKGIVEKKKENANKIFEKVEIEASFKGGEKAWYKYLENNLEPGVAVENGAPEGRYTVYVQFVVSKDGSISDVKALTSNGYGLEAEAVRVVKNGPAWIPAIQNGRRVNAYRKQPVIFQVQY